MGHDMKFITRIQLCLTVTCFDGGTKIVPGNVGEVEVLELMECTLLFDMLVVVSVRGLPFACLPPYWIKVLRAWSLIIRLKLRLCNGNVV